MGLNSTPSANRIHIALFGMRNAGKSSLINKITNQELAVVSETKGTTTDPVYKAMELLPIGPVVIVDTPGIDDEGELGEKRIVKTREVLAKTDVAILVTEASRPLCEEEKELIGEFEQKKLPFIIVRNKKDLCPAGSFLPADVHTSAVTGDGIEELKNKIGEIAKISETKPLITEGLAEPGDFVILVIPIDQSAPKGRLILPQQQVIRDLLDRGVTAVSVKDTEYEQTLKDIGKKPAAVICDSQVFGKVNKVTPTDIRLTSFSILMARMKGFLETAVSGAKAISNLKNGDRVLISEACTHHRQCADIGTVKLPTWIKKHCNAEIVFEFSSGGSFPEDLSVYSLIVHCGGCMITEKEVQHRMNRAIESKIPFTNYGTAIAYMNGILDRSIEAIPEL